jgi:phage terminase small subunit
VLDKKGNQVYVETPDGEMLPAYVFDAKDVLKGCELLGKHLGMFIDKKEVTGKDGGPLIIKLDGELEEWAK